MICFFYKRLISARVTEDKAMPAFVERHLSKCEECRQFLRDHSNIARRLRLEAGAGEHLFAARASQAAGNKDKRFNTIRTGRIAASFIGAAVILFMTMHWSGPSRQQIECLDESAQSVVAASPIQYAAIAGASGSHKLEEQYTGLESFAKNAFMLVYNSFTAATDAPGVESEAQGEI